ncbi:MAG TPA: aldehyde dehydrogenase family protein [Hyphomicrobiaceae bacterium]|nr:aldehyde dehydrogenase family protein [Hyphomicrobiaceae bacterium]
MIAVDLMINNADAKAAGNATFERLNPMTGDIAARAAASSADDATRAADAAAAAFPAWAEMAPAARRASPGLAAAARVAVLPVIGSRRSKVALPAAHASALLINRSTAIMVSLPNDLLLGCGSAATRLVTACRRTGLPFTGRCPETACGSAWSSRPGSALAVGPRRRPLLSSLVPPR